MFSNYGTVWMILLLIAGWFFALISVSARVFSHVKIQELFKKFNRESQADAFFADSEKISLSCSLVTVGLNICVTILLLRHFGTSRISQIIYAAVTAFVLITFFEVFIAGAWAAYAGEIIIAWTYPFLRVMVFVFAPLNPLFKLHDLIVRRLAGVAEGRARQQEQKQEEFLSAVEQSKIEGAVDEIEQEMIEHVLELNDTTAEEIMTPRTDIVALRADSDLQTVLDTITAEGHSRIPVYEDTVDSIIGLVYAKDLLGIFGKDAEQFRLRDKLREAYFVPETKTLRLLLAEFQKQKLHIAVVLDEYGGTAGIVTIEDIIEEVVGEIADEYEELPPESLKMIDEFTAEVDARMNIDDFNEEFDVELPEEEDYDTVGGFVFSHLGYIPKTGETFDYDNMKFTIVSGEKRKINRIKVQKATPESQ